MYSHFVIYTQEETRKRAFNIFIVWYQVKSSNLRYGFPQVCIKEMKTHQWALIFSWHQRHKTNSHTVYETSDFQLLKPICCVVRTLSLLPVAHSRNLCIQHHENDMCWVTWNNRKEYHTTKKCGNKCYFLNFYAAWQNNIFIHEDSRKLSNNIFKQFSIYYLMMGKEKNQWKHM